MSGIATWDPLDVLRSPESGSVLIRKTLAGTVDTAMGQCVPVTAGKLYDIGARILIPTGQSATALARVAPVFYASQDCSGAVLGTPVNYLVESYAGGGDFHALAAQPTAPAGANSALIELKVTDSGNPSAVVEAHFDDVIFAPAGGCISNTKALSGTLCLEEGRFRVVATYTTPTSSSPTRAQVVQLTADSGYFWFFNPENTEVTVKVLNACGVNSRHWVFAAGMTNLGVTLSVTDSVTGATKIYTNPLNTAYTTVLDVNAFPCP